MRFNRIHAAGLLAMLAMLPCQAGAVDANQAKAREIFAKVISIPTSVGLGKVPEEANYLAGEFRKGGFPDADIHVLPLGETASLVVRYRGDGSGGKPILFMAHMDVVTAKREDWQRDPYTLIEENGFFYGRGTLDIKSGITELTATFLRLKAEGYKPKRDLIIVFSGDEETDGKTAQDLVKNHRDLVDAEYALNSDAGGGSMDENGRELVFGLQTAEKTYASFELTVRNPGGHSSLPRPDNAIYELADALKKLQAYRFPVMWNDTTVAYYRATSKVTQGKIGEAMGAFAKDPHDTAAAEVLTSSPQEIGRIRTTCVPTLLRGGHADNALPQSATATVNCRIFPGISVADVGKTLQSIVGPSVELKVIGEPFATDPSPLRADVMAAVTSVVHKLHPGVPVVPTQEAGATDGIYFRGAGIPTYGVGSAFIKDSDAFAHGLNERLPVKSFYQDLDHWYLLIKALSGPQSATRKH
jgi:acetylornithine deacetylase/succinyl-diaminopimelate desuccinylase-like protein